MTRAADQSATDQSAAAWLAHADALYAAGNLAEAERWYRRVLESRPRSVPALHRLGAIAGRSREFLAALRLFDQALGLEPDNALLHVDRAVALRALGRRLEALASLDTAVELAPHLARAHAGRGNALLDVGRREEALRCYDRALALDPDHAETHYNRGVALQGAGQLDAALASYRAAIARRPDYAAAHCNAGVVHEALRRFEGALDCYDRLLAFDPRHAAAHSNRSNVLGRLRRWDEALASADRALAIAPRLHLAHLNRGVALLGLGFTGEALASFEQAAALEPGSADAHARRAAALNLLQRWSEAGAALERALELQPDHAQALCSRGYMLGQCDQAEAALACFARALEIDPRLAEAHCNRAALLAQMNRIDAAVESFERAIELDPTYAEPRFFRALLLLKVGRYEEGWREQEWRWRCASNAHIRPLAAGMWLGGEPVAGRQVLLWGEQGLGDILQFGRYASLLARRGAHVILEVPATLVGVMSTLEGVERVIARGSPRPPFDLHCSLMSLPLALGTRLETIPAWTRYLSAEPPRIAFWGERLGPSMGRLRVGIVWAGGPRPYQPELAGINRRRNLPLALLASIAHPRLELVSLQKGAEAEAELADYLAGSGVQIRNVADELVDFAATAALIENLDLVISVDTSTAHLAAALGKPVWILNRFDGCWRWFEQREDSPWYPTVRLYRQRQAGNWSEVIERVQRDLQALIG